jgi:L-threonylcarbamoyladenylate synthase
MAQGFLSLEDAAGLLKSGGVLVLGTDTLPGLHCRADDAEAVDRIIAMKGRSAGHSFGVIAGSAEQAALVSGPLEDRAAAYCRKCWPGPFSLILPASGSLCTRVASETGTVAVRVPAVPSLRTLLLEVGYPLVSTSANLTGNPPHTTLAGACLEFGHCVDGAWEPFETKTDRESGKIPLPSSLIDLSSWPPKVLRRGSQDPPPAG